jgi:hypothetical protein
MVFDSISPNGKHHRRGKPSGDAFVRLSYKSVTHVPRTICYLCPRSLISICPMSRADPIFLPLLGGKLWLWVYITE